MDRHQPPAIDGFLLATALLAQRNTGAMDKKLQRFPFGGQLLEGRFAVLGADDIDVIGLAVDRPGSPWCPKRLKSKIVALAPPRAITATIPFHLPPSLPTFMILAEHRPQIISSHHYQRLPATIR
ncbi:hypothetical protein J1C48_14135 [Jiella sp. CQZ9-1]|uniref:Uncharacterized protein n=2 Tax=Jiella flava TaxID=2816857 RepID=A0A939JWP2_9HYPH|nr:hypothetical protein [Jiella flava]